MEDQLSSLFGVLGNITSILIFASPMKTFWRIVRNRSTEDFDVLPYIMALLSSSLWTYYGLTRPGRLLIATVDSVGIILETTYVILFVIFASPERRARTGKLVAFLNLGFFGGFVLVTRLAMHGSTRYDVIGFFCVITCSFSYTSPLAIMKLVIRTKSVEYMPFLLSFFIFINGVVWTTYAVLVGDVFIGLPSGIGFLLGSTQLILYCIYWKPRGQQHIDEGNSGQESLIEPSQAQKEIENGLTTHKSVG